MDVTMDHSTTTLDLGHDDTFVETSNYNTSIFMNDNEPTCKNSITNNNNNNESPKIQYPTRDINGLDLFGMQEFEPQNLNLTQRFHLKHAPLDLTLNKSNNSTSVTGATMATLGKKFTKIETSEKDSKVATRKKEQNEANHMTKKRRDSSGTNQQSGSSKLFTRTREFSSRSKDSVNNSINSRRSVSVMARDKKRSKSKILGEIEIDLYNIETMPTIDLEAIESHLQAAREEERKRRTDREEIRRRLAMGADDDYATDHQRHPVGRKPSFQSRLQSGMNLQICFMNETLSDDNDSPGSDSDSKQPTIADTSDFTSCQNRQSRPATLTIGSPLREDQQPHTGPDDADFFARQARLQVEARMALAQAKEMARMQMEIERQRQKKSPITEMVRHSLEKVGIPFPEEKRRMSRQILTEMNVAQLQVIVNDLHTQIEILNEKLVKFLMGRDDLHMEQDSMLVDIEDLTRYLRAKKQTSRTDQLSDPISLSNHLGTPNNNMALPFLENSLSFSQQKIVGLVTK